MLTVAATPKFSTWTFKQYCVVGASDAPASVANWVVVVPSYLQSASLLPLLAPLAEPTNSALLVPLKPNPMARWVGDEAEPKLFAPYTRAESHAEVTGPAGNGLLAAIVFMPFCYT